MDAAAAASSSTPPSHHPTSSTRDSPWTPGSVLCTSSKILDSFVTKTTGAAGDPCGMPVSTRLASALFPSSTSFTWRSGVKLPVHLIRSGWILSASIPLPRCDLLTLLKAYLTPMNSAPATSFPPHACWVRFTRIATASMQEFRFRYPNCPSGQPLHCSRRSAIRWAAVRSTSLLMTSRSEITRYARTFE